MAAKWYTIHPDKVPPAQLGVRVTELSPRGLRYCIRLLVNGLKERGVETSVAPPAPPVNIVKSRTMHRGPYGIRYVELYNIEYDRMEAALDTLYHDPAIPEAERWPLAELAG